MNDWDEGFYLKNLKKNEHVYRPSRYHGCEAQNASLGVKFAQAQVILDPWWIVGGTRWSRTLFRLKHPIVYTKRGLRKLFRSIKVLILGEPCAFLCRKFITKGEAYQYWPKI